MKDHKIILLDYSNGNIVVLENLPTQDYINQNYEGNWEHWLYTIQDERENIPRIKDCEWMLTSKFSIDYIYLIDKNKSIAELTKDMLAPFVEKAIKRKNSYEQGLE